MPLQRYYSKFKTRSTGYYNPLIGIYFSELSKSHKNITTLEQLFQVCDTEVVYIMPDKYGKYPTKVDYNKVPNLPRVKYLEKRQSATIYYDDKRRVSLYPVTTWFTPRQEGQVIQGIDTIQKVIEDNFQPAKVHAGKEDKFSIPLLATPAQMGNDLLKRSLPYGKEYPTLPTDLSETIFHNFGQGRVETFFHGEDELPQVYDYDGRWMYSSCLRHMPVGRVLHDYEPEIMWTEYSKTGTRGIIPGFYRVTAIIPDDWNHIGLLPTQVDEHTVYPRQPGHQFESWCSTAELKLAVKMGWGIKVHERILWPDTDKEPDVLKAFCDKLKNIRMTIAEKYPEPMRSYLRDSARNILLQTVGSFHRHQSEFDWYVHDRWEVPETASNFKRLARDLFVYSLPEKLSPLQKMLAHPEWSGMVWGLARAKIAEQALQMQFEDIVALRVDAVWTARAYDIPDDGKVGQFKLEHKSMFSRAWPKDNSDMLAVVRSVKGHDDDAAYMSYGDAA